MTEPFKTELKNDKLTYTQWFIFTIIGVLGVFSSTQASIEPEIKISAITIFSIVLLYGLLLSQKKIYIGFQGNNLVVESKMLGINKLKYYRLVQIEHLTYRRNVNSGVSKSSGHVRILGFDATPGSWKEYYYHKEVINFEYMGRKVEIGKWKKAYNGDRLVAKIKEEKKLK